MSESKLDVSIIIPFYKKFDELKYSLIYNAIYFSQVKEVILIIDESIDHNNLSKFLYILNHDINFNIYVNSENHEWRKSSYRYKFWYSKSYFQ